MMGLVATGWPALGAKPLPSLLHHLTVHPSLARAWTCSSPSTDAHISRRLGPDEAAIIFSCQNQIYFNESPATFKTISVYFSGSCINCCCVVLWRNSFTLFFFFSLLIMNYIRLHNTLQRSNLTKIPPLREGRCCQYVDIAGLWLLKGEGIKMNVKNKWKD